MLRLSLLSSVEVAGKRDETYALAAAPVAVDADDSTLTLERRSSAWSSASVRVECRRSHLIVRHQMEGQGALGRAVLLGGYAVTARASGPIYSGTELPSLFSPGPHNPRRTASSSEAAAVVGVSGDSLAGRGHWFFTPGPLCFALGKQGGPWVVIGLLAPVEEMTFPELVYQPLDNGFRLEVDYEGHAGAAGTFRPPAVVVVPGCPDPPSGVGTYRKLLEDHGFAPGEAHRRGRARERAPWWSEPMFCGWGSQCHLAVRANTTALDQCTQANYDTFLAELTAHGLKPGTVVVDDGWQEQYALPTPDPERWPSLRSWIRHRHEQGQKVLLWWRAWSPQGAPRAACLTNAAGHPVAAGPVNDEATAWLEATIRDLLSPDGLDADGLKVDFTAMTPRGWHVGGEPPGTWGIALLHRYLSVVYAAAKKAKPDALVITHSANPAFATVTDMVRLNDMLRLDEPQPWAPVVEQMSYRASIVRAACPGTLVDTDDWCAPDLAQWREYLAVKGAIGVPALYYTTHLDRTGQALEERDYEQLRQVWSEARARTQPSGEAEP